MRKTNSLNEKENAGHTKKTWQRPEIYILDTNDVNGGAGIASQEIRTGNHKMHTYFGGIDTFGTGTYNNYHS